jgi:hypothetical protein
MAEPSVTNTQSPSSQTQEAIANIRQLDANNHVFQSVVTTTQQNMAYDNMQSRIAGKVAAA